MQMRCKALARWMSNLLKMTIQEDELINVCRSGKVLLNMVNTLTGKSITPETGRSTAISTTNVSLPPSRHGIPN